MVNPDQFIFFKTQRTQSSPGANIRRESCLSYSRTHYLVSIRVTPVTAVRTALDQINQSIEKENQSIFFHTTSQNWKQVQELP